MRTAPIASAAATSATTPTTRCTPALFRPPPEASDLAAILVPLLRVIHGGRSRSRVEAVGRGRELRDRRAPAGIASIGGELQVRDRDDTGQLRHLRQER